MRPNTSTAGGRFGALNQAVLAAVGRLARRFSPGRLAGRFVAGSYPVPVEFGMLTPRWLT